MFVQKGVDVRPSATTSHVGSISDEAFLPSVFPSPDTQFAVLHTAALHAPHALTPENDEVCVMPPIVTRFHSLSHTHTHTLTHTHICLVPIYVFQCTPFVSSVLPRIAVEPLAA